MSAWHHAGLVVLIFSVLNLTVFGTVVVVVLEQRYAAGLAQHLQKTYDV